MQQRNSHYVHVQSYMKHIRIQAVIIVKLRIFFMPFEVKEKEE